MAIKATLLGLFIYAGLAAYVLAFLALMVRQHRAGRILFLSAFPFCAAAFIARWAGTGAPPLQNLFDVFITLAFVLVPLAWFCDRKMDVPVRLIDPLIGLLILFPAGFVFSAEPRALPPALQSPIFIPHVIAYMLAYVLMFKAVAPATRALFATHDSGLAGEAEAHRLVRLSFPLLTLGLILGAWWAKLAWGDYWGWDPKELWSLATWLVYAAYLHFRGAFGGRIRRANGAFVLAGAMACLLTLSWVNLATRLFPGLHAYGQ